MHENNRGCRLLRRPSILVAAALIAGTGFSVVPAGTAVANPTSLCGAYATAQFGANVCVFTPPSGATAANELTAIQTAVNNIAIQQVPISAQFNDEGYALLFEPGTYGSATTPLVFQAGYYTEVAGLGAVPQDTVINGQVEVLANDVDCASPTNCWGNSDDNFWRSMSNLTLNVENNSPSDYVPTPITELPPISVTYGGSCFDGTGPVGSNTDLWSSSQASPVRSVIINGNLNWQQYCSGANDYASGSYVANSLIQGTAGNGQLAWSGNQQGIARNTDFQSAAGYVWNYVYSGDACPPGYTPPTGTACSPTEDAFNGSYDIGSGTDGINGVNQITELPQSPVTEEEPFLYTGTNGNWDAFVPAVQDNSVGPNFVSGSEAGTSVLLSSFFIASPTTPELQIQTALNMGRNLILTPGTYDLDAPITVWHPDTLVIGLGFPVLVPQRGNQALVVVPNNGVKLSGMIVDAGPVNSPVLVSVGTPGFNWGGGFAGANNANDPDLIQDVYFRVGGAETTAVSATVSLLDNANNSIIDDIWAWRADHGASSVTGPEGQQGAGWTYNQGDTGLEVTGNNVTAYGLAVEHYQKNEIIWSGNGGTAVYLQNELPYDAPSQAAWAASPSQPGYPAFLVTNNVQTFNGYGLASYVVFIYTPATLWDAMAYQAPNTPGVQFTDAMDLFISSTCSVSGSCTTGCTPGSCVSPYQSGGDDSVINGVGGPATNENGTTPVDVDSYSNWNTVLPTH
jgi:hypothetical protein